MKLVGVEFKDCGPLKDYKAEFVHPLTKEPLHRIVFCGSNGSGKTTIIRVLQSYFSAVSHIELLKNFPGTVDAILRFRDGLSTWHEGFHKANFEQAHDGKYDHIPFKPDNIWPKPYLIVGLSNRLYRVAPNGSQQGNGHDFVVSIGQNDDLHQYFINSAVKDFNETRAGRSSHVFDQAIAPVNVFIAPKRIKEFQFDNERNPDLRIELPDGTDHSIKDVSSGEEQVILLLSTIERYAKPGMLVAIDEPELSLHPTWQIRLFKVLSDMAKERDFQVIFATHSVEILSHSDPWEIFPLDPEYKKLKVKLDSFAKKPRK